MVPKCLTFFHFIVGQCRKIAVASNDLQYFTFPKEQEGNIYAVNWSLVEDGVVANGSAFRNARLQQLQNQMKSSTKPAFDGKYTVEEAGDNLDHATFHNYLMEAQQNLSSAHNLFVEDGFVGAHRDARTGVRLITASAHSASLLRKMLVCMIPKFLTFLSIMSFTFRSQLLASMLIPVPDSTVGIWKVAGRNRISNGMVPAM